MIVNQWVPAAHRGDAVGDSARRVRDLLRGMGHQADVFALTIDEDLHGDVRPVCGSRVTPGRPDHLPLRARLADGPRSSRASRGRVLQYHNVTPAHFFGPWDSAMFRLAELSRDDLRSLARPHGRGARQTRSTTDRSWRGSGSPTRGCSTIAWTCRAVTARRSSGPRFEAGPGRRAAELPVRGPHRPPTRRSRTTSAWRSSTSATWTSATGSSSSAGPTACHRYYNMVRALIAEFQMPPTASSSPGPSPTRSWRCTTGRRASTSRCPSTRGFCVPLLRGHGRRRPGARLRVERAGAGHAWAAPASRSRPRTSSSRRGAALRARIQRSPARIGHRRPAPATAGFRRRSITRELERLVGRPGGPS